MAARIDHVNHDTYLDALVWVVSHNAVLSAAVAAGLRVVGWTGAWPVTAARGSVWPTAAGSKIVLVADEDGALPELSAMVPGVDGSVVVISSLSAGRSLLLAVQRGAFLVDAQQPLLAQLRAVGRALAGEVTADGDMVVGRVRRWMSEAERVATLTAREAQVLDLLMCGGSAQEIADRLVVSLSTVRTHIRAIMHKLGVSSQLAAAAMAWRLRCGTEPRRGQSHQI